MSLTKTRSVALAALLALGAFAAPVHAADGDYMQEYRAFMTKMANQEGRVTKKDFLAFMERKFDEMDKQRSGTLTPDELVRIFGRIGTP